MIGFREDEEQDGEGRGGEPEQRQMGCQVYGFSWNGQIWSKSHLPFFSCQGQGDDDTFPPRAMLRLE